eukprot:TRINITY_DN58887_c0_g1_i1.p1 TRINITY_DN58887_c0_g1~~TRINITY_DN58887_c0_g1_i1.p1  ORF type:complete len:410 (-),score=86.48 TRINITY_DN58887_c0_g1_i1:126-1355(-)
MHGALGRRLPAAAVAVALLAWVGEVCGFAVVDISACLEADVAASRRACESAVAALDAAFRLSGLAVVIGLQTVAHGGLLAASAAESQLRNATVKLSELLASDAGLLEQVVQAAEAPGWSLEAEQRHLGCLALWATGPAAEGSACHSNDTAYVLEVEGLAEAAAASDVQTPEMQQALSGLCLQRSRWGAATAADAPNAESSFFPGGRHLDEALAQLRVAVLQDFAAQVPVRETVVALVERALRMQIGELRQRVQVRDVAGYRMHHYLRGGSGRRDVRFYHKHVDAGTIRLIRLDPASPEGLEVQLEQGDVLQVPYVENSIILLVGDTMERVTNGRWRGARHRVTFNAGSDAPPRTTLRSSVFHFRPDELLTCLPGCCEDRGFKFPELTAEQLMRHFRDNGALLAPRGVLF